MRIPCLFPIGICFDFRPRGAKSGEQIGPRDTAPARTQFGNTLEFLTFAFSSLTMIAEAQTEYGSHPPPKTGVRLSRAVRRGTWLLAVVRRDRRWTRTEFAGYRPQARQQSRTKRATQARLQSQPLHAPAETARAHEAG